MFLKKDARIGSLNYIKGPFVVALFEKSEIGNRNHIKRADYPVSWGHSIFRLGKS
jgi:hypothetical protein